jgi:L-fucose dehydrogenase
MTREWAAELLPYGIRVNAVIPAEVTTLLDQQQMTMLDELAAVVVFLISSKAGHITGQHVLVDGG